MSFDHDGRRVVAEVGLVDVEVGDVDGAMFEGCFEGISDEVGLGGSS